MHHDQYDPDLHGYLRAPPAQRIMALAVALIAAVLIGGFAWLMIQALGG